MPPSFACLAWPAGNEDATRRAEHLVSALETHQPERPTAFRMPGLYLADLSPTGQPACRILPLHDAEGGPAGCLYGTLFRREAGAQRPLDRLGPEETRRICRTGGGALMTEYWGHYVLILKTGDTASLLADPMSAIPCLYRWLGEITCIFSHLETCPDEFSTGLTLDLASLRRLRVYDKIQTGRTGYGEIRELGGGQRRELSRNPSPPETLWDPRRLASQPLRLSDEDAAEALRDTVRDCVGSWAAACEHIVMDLSGGLDSSIVTACLARVCDDKRLDIVHHHIRSADAPELVHAQATCAHLGLDLLALDVAPTRPLPDPDAHPPSARPWRNFLGLGFDRILPDRMKSPGTTFFTGQGGDHLFLMTRSPLGLTDFVRQGAYARLWTEWLNAARLSETSLWQTFASNLPYLLGRPARSALKTGILERLARLDLPSSDSGAWLDGLPDWAMEPGDLPPGKFEQISTLPHLFQIRDPLARASGRHVIHPLLSQPLIELCLKIPVWQLCLGGINRGLARMAFTADLPEQIRRRTTKGEATQYFARQLSRNWETVSAALSDGCLMEAGLLGRDELDRLLADRAMMAPSTFRDLLQLYTLEAWMRAAASRAARPVRR